VTPRPAPTDHLLRDAIERNAGWIRKQIRPIAQGATAEAYIQWLFVRLRDRVTDITDPDELDRLVRAETRHLYGSSKDRLFFERKAPSDIETMEDLAALTFEHDLEESDQIQACLECLPKVYRDLIIQAYALAPSDLDTEQTRTMLARKLGISRSTLNQRVSRALQVIKRRMGLTAKRRSNP
jgi:DNA-directed RNA polymerase specialized sigma24 family protein